MVATSNHCGSASLAHRLCQEQDDLHAWHYYIWLKKIMVVGGGGVIVCVN